MIDPSTMQQASPYTQRLAAAVTELTAALDEMLATHELREHNGDTITPLQRAAMEQARKALGT